MDVNTLANLVTTIAVVIGVGFGLVEIRRAGRDRRDRAAVEVVRSVQTQDIQRAVGMIMNLPDDADPELIRRDPVMLDAAMLAYFACEMFGTFVFEGVVELHTLDRMVGGWVRSTWMRLRKWIISERIQNRNVNEGEWWQWLYEQLLLDPDPGKAIGANAAYRSWRRGMRGSGITPEVAPADRALTPAPPTARAPSPRAASEVGGRGARTGPSRRRRTSVDPDRGELRS
jgi:hypothetical protein